MPATLGTLLQTARKRRITPCNRFYAFKLKTVILTLSCGQHTYDEDAPRLRHDDLFDLASLTKVIATTSLTMLLFQPQRLSLDATIDTWLPERRALNQPQPTIRQLLAHCAGFPAGRPFHSTHADTPPGDARKAAVIATPAVCAPGTQTVYSDIGFMLLGFILERIADAPLDQLAKTLVFKPLKMRRTTFCPPPEWQPHCVPTELDDSLDPPRPWQGTVHDENARWLGGVAGHAGLFSTAHDLSKLAKALLDPSIGPFDPNVIQLFTQRAGLVPDSDRCLGWQAPFQPFPDCPRQFRRLPSYLFGHTGFTGTSFWIAPEPQCAVILLSNAVHPHRADKKRYFPWRNDVHSHAMNTLLRYS